ncbi:lamin tail domain-containing protein [Winogradskyella forsetii]|uniref:lamin tail domain-containing protein n=1 Tax=Winogradskyella forsetii TaxID=2686077 RepID=UPI0015BCFE79|nr:lamin tail domain-containing protein [Winogradskyella forsetii]
MIKKYALIFITFLCFSLSGYGQADIIISQYIETDSGTSPKGIEIFNISGSAITFSAANNLEVYQGTNGASCSSVVNITSGTLGIDEVWVIGTTDLITYTTTNGSDFSGTTTFDFLFNGDDALEVYLGGIIQDSFGICGSDPGSSWTGGGVDTRNNNLQIKNGICDGDIDGWTDPSVRFDGIELGSDMTGFGDAPASCNPTNTIVNFTSTTSSIAEDGLFVDICVEIINESATTATTVDIELDGSSTATNGSDYDDGAGSPAPITFPFTLTFPANSSANQCFTIFISNDDLLVEGDEIVVLNLTNPGGGDSAATGTDDQHILTIIDNDVAAIADVIITEIMYNTSGTDDEWIEICNTSGSAQVLNNYTIRYNGSTEFTFPSSGSVIADGACITISLGDGGGSEYNVDCPFTPDYTNGLGTGTLGNTSATISLVASDGSTTIDSVFYDDNDDTLTDGNGASFHVIDDSADNSNTDTNWQAVVDGGSPGTNSLVSPCSSLQPEINIEGDLGAFPNINNNDVTPSFLDNTQFSDRLLGDSQTKSFRIQNIGTADLTVSNVQIVGVDAGDFSLTFPSALPFIIPQNGIIVFDVTFSPTVAAVRNATVRITNDDPTDSENIFEFAIRGTGICSASTNVLFPLTGPDNTVVTIIGTDLGGSTFVEFDGNVIPHTVISSTEIEITIPANSVTGNIDITDNLGCLSSDLFTIIDTAIGSCEGNGGTTPNNLFISEVTDASVGGMTYIEIYNGTGAPIDLINYSLQFYKNGSNTVNGGSVNLSPSVNLNLNTGDTFVVAIGTSGSTCTGIPDSGGEKADLSSGISGLNFDPGSDDHIRLYEGTNHRDSWGTHESDNWADPLGIGTEGVVFRRNSTAAMLPDPTFNVTDWSYVNWNSCAENDYSTIGSFDFSTGVPPTVTLQPIAPAFECTFSASLTISGTEGFDGGGDTQELAYQWYFNQPGTSTWTEILPANSNYTGQQTATLNIIDTMNLDGYQYYCQLREDSSTCFEASNAIKLDVRVSTWNGTWSVPPSLDRFAILNANYNTGDGTNGQDSFGACGLVVNAGTLTVANSNFVEVANDVTVETGAEILVETQGAFVQRGVGAAAGTFNLNGTATSQVNKLTAPLANWYDYTYWSSPVATADVDVALGFANQYRRFWYDASLYLDADNNDIDDDDNDWTLATGSGQMIVGRGYAATHNSTGFVAGNQYQYNFEGALNTGDYTYPLSYNASNTDHWNLVGNPYPSAIKVRGTDGLFDANTGVIKTAVYLWSHDSPPLGANPGNENLNFNSNDYAVINETMSTAGASGDTPENYIPSGQSFFVSSLTNADIAFNNAMRISGDNSNDLFFRNAVNNDAEPMEESRLWLNLTADGGVFNQLGVGYVHNATDGFDGLGYDAKRNLSSGSDVIIYSQIEEEDYRLAIQGKAVTSLNLDEIIPIGFSTSIEDNLIYKFSIYDFEGQFLIDNPIFIKDNQLNTIHNLKDSDYSFTSSTGEFNNRFEIVFTPSTLSIDDHFIDANALTIVELPNGDVEFKLNSKKNSISNVEILDALGRRIYNLKGSNATEVYNLSQLSQSAYIAKITLSNGQVISKKAIKQR